MNTYTQRVREAARLAILAELAASAGYETNHSVLTSALHDSGIRWSATAVRSEMEWLAEAGLVSTRTVEPFTIARLTERGRDVEGGLAFVDGVKRPDPPF